MTILDIVSALDEEIARLQGAKSILQEIPMGKRVPGRPATSSFKGETLATKPSKRRTMSAEGRARIAAAQKARWAAQKKTNATPAPTKVASPTEKSPARAVTKTLIKK